MNADRFDGPARNLCDAPTPTSPPVHARPQPPCPPAEGVESRPVEEVTGEVTELTLTLTLTLILT